MIRPEKPEHRMQASIMDTLSGPYSYLRGTDAELERFLPEIASLLPTPQRIFLQDESAEPMMGFPVLHDLKMQALDEALRRYLQAEEVAQLSIRRRQPYDRAAPGVAWNQYKSRLERAVEHATVASYGRRYPAVFWLAHSLEVARWLVEVPKRIRRIDLQLGKEQGEEIKYRVFERYIDQVLTVTYDTVHRLAKDSDEQEEELFPRLLSRMFDNVLILTETRVSLDLADLAAYFKGYLRKDARDLRQRHERLTAWAEERLRTSETLRSAVRNLLEADPDQPAARLCTYPGMVSHLSHEPGYDPRSFFDPAQVELWEKLLVKLKEFELLNLARNQIMPLQREGNDWVFRAGGLNRTWCGQRFMHLSTSTRPLDFMAPWVLDPRVERFGMAYDISSFSQVISMLRRAGQETQDRSYRQLFRFQRQLYRLADGYGLKLEKYLGDGAFFTGRHALQTLLFALRTQRLYREAVDGGFPFDRGMRVGMNFSSYRLIPIEAAKSGGLDRYEFFGHGVVELSRLTTGKATGDVEEVKNWLISRGYPRHAVLRFFEPVAEADLDVVDKELDSHRFYSYINRNGTLINEGIVATREMLRRLDEGLNSPSLYHSRRGGYLYTVVGLEDEAAQCYVGIRKLGVARFKGLDEIPVYELLDGADLEEGFRETEHVGSLLEALDRDFAANLRQNR